MASAPLFLASAPGKEGGGQLPSGGCNGSKKQL